jgi:hypothetical protein
MRRIASLDISESLIELKELVSKQTTLKGENLKEWLHKTVTKMDSETIKSITGNHHFLKVFNAAFIN